MEEIIKLRRHFRKLAETAWLEMKTTMEIIQYLKNMRITTEYGSKIHTHRTGLPDEKTIQDHASKINTSKYNFDTSEILKGYTGCIAIIKSNIPGKNIALRFDIDALPLHESDDPMHIPNIENFRSEDNLTCHACGHDGHIAIGLETAKYIKENIAHLKGTYTIIFQPAEEGVRGASSIVNTKYLDNIDCLIGCHIGMNVKDGIIAVGSEGFMATEKYDVKFTGKSAHASSSPEEGKNALLGAASCIMSLYSITQYGNGSTRINIGKLNAGTGRNLIPEEAKMEMEIRADRNEILKDLDNKTKRIIKYSALSYDLQYEIKKMGEAMSFTSRKKEEISEIANYLEKNGMITEKFTKFKGSEDISCMLQKVEDNGGIGIHLVFGTNLKAPHHNGKFDYNEEVLTRGAKALRLIIEYLNE